MYMCDLHFDQLVVWAGLWFKSLWYDLGSLRGQESCEDGCPEYLFGTGTLISQLNQ